MPDGGKLMKSLRSLSAGENKNRIYAVLAAALLITAALSLCLGAEKIDVISALRDFAAGEQSAGARIIRYVRLPRTCAGLLAGASLAVSGAVIQAVLSNSLASPGTIGVNAGAGLAVALSSAFLPDAVLFSPLAALAGAFGGTMLVLYIGQSTGASKLTLVLAGVAVSGIFSACIDAVVTFVPDALNAYSDFRIGGLAGVTMPQLLRALIIALPAFAAVLSLHTELDVLMLGSEQAQSLGLNSKKMQVVFLFLASALSGAAVSFSGLIGFVGLIVPHIMRQLLGEESGPLIIGSAMGGAVLLCLCDLLSRLVFAPFERPAGILMALTGGPFFIWLLRRRGGMQHD